jgi:hypothetical protein
MLGSVAHVFLVVGYIMLVIERFVQSYPAA